MSRWRSVWLVARREIIERGRSRGFILSVLFTTLLVVGGYALYSTALGFLGALASRMEEASNASTPVTMIAMVSYFVAIFAVVGDPSGTIATVATYIPPAAPFVVPLRAAFDAIGPLEIAISVAITLAAIWALFNVGRGSTRARSSRPPAG